ncbi:helix-turn-helix domain-containing protein [Actinotalea sp.]|uniref:helix-turn-helix domain-containing protein n=1 Tax=Actinotalea sp. TaxID=1872145 RepID=UPI00356175B6
MPDFSAQNRIARIGPRLRSARQAHGWTLQDLADRAEMSASTLSRLESGKRQATLELLVPLTQHLGIRLDDLLPADRPDPRVRRAAERHDGVTSVPLMPEHAPVQSYKITMPPRLRAPAPRTHDGFEWFYVLNGRVRLLLDEIEHVLEPGEAAEFDTLVPHSISAVGDAPAEIISVFSAAGDRIHMRVGGD